LRIVIIGNGVAGMQAAMTIRKREPDWEITVISEESDHFFSRTALMYIMCGQLSHQDIEPLERDAYANLGLKRVRARATGIDTEARTVLMAGDHPSVPFDRLIVAVGSRPAPAPFWKGYGALRGIGHFVTHQDLQWLEREVHGGPSRGGDAPRPDAHLAYSTPDSPYQPRLDAASSRGSRPKNVAVIGGGLIGVESVEVLLKAGYNPHFLIREDWFWPMAIDQAESTWIAEEMGHHGVNVHLQTNVTGFEGDGNGNLALTKTDKGDLETELVVVAIGVKPNTTWLADGPLQIDKFGGILVDEGLQTNVEGIFACGDCASVRWFNDVVRPEQLWYTARDQGRIAGKRALGDDVTYSRGLFYNSAKLMDIEYTTAGYVGWQLEGEQEFFFHEKDKVRSTTRIVHRNGAVIGFNMLGRRWDHSILLRWIEQRRSLAWVKAHLNEARFDTEFVPPLQLAG